MSPSENPYLYILLAGALASECWRWIGVLISGHLREDSEWLNWVRAVAGALVAGVIARLILFPTGILADTDMWLRILAVAVGFSVFLAAKRSVLASVIAADAVLILGITLLS